MKKTLAVIFSSLFLLGSVACAPSQATESTGGIDPNLSALKCGFTCLDEMRFFEYKSFYKAAVNTDKQYITEGETSGKFSFNTNAAVPQFKVWSNTNFFGDDDFTKAQAITVEVFNPSEKTHKMWMSFTTSTNGEMKYFQTYPETEYTLNKGYNLIVFTLDRAIANYLCDMKNVAHIDFRFQNETAPYDLYFDNLRVHYTDEALETAEKTYEENELLNFNDPMDIFFVQPVALMCRATELPSVSICRDPKYIKSGNGSLMIELSSAERIDDKYPTVSVQGAPVERIDFSQYTKIKYTVYSNHSNWVDVRVRDVNGVRCTIQWQDGSFEDGVGKEREIDIAYLVEKGLDVTSLAAIEFNYGHKQNTGGMALFIDEITLVK